MAEGQIRGTCGHKLSDKWWDSGKGSIAIKDHDKGQRCVSYMVVCPECKKDYTDIILPTVKSRKEWLRQYPKG